MPRPRNVVPQPRQHKGRAVLDVYENGVRRTRTLGAWGSEEAHAEYRRFLAQFATSSRDQPAGGGSTVTEVLLAFLNHAERHYRHPNGSHTSEVGNFKMAIRPLRELYGHTLAREFGPKALKTLRDQMIGLGWCRGQVNAAVARVKRVFKWAASEELVSANVFHALQTVTGLRAGRSAAKEREPVQPVADDIVSATLPFLNRHVRAMVEFQRLTGCRPGEVCVLRRCDIDTSGTVWLYRPRHHKNAHRGKPRSIAIGPRAQELIRPFLTDDPADYLFSPRRAVGEGRGPGRDPRHPALPVAPEAERGQAGRGPATDARRAVHDRQLRALHRPGLRAPVPAAGAAGPAQGRIPCRLERPPDAGPARRTAGVARGPPVAAEPDPPHVRHQGPQDRRAGSGSGNARPLEGRYDPDLRRPR